MLIDQYYKQQQKAEHLTISFSREQASAFAKQIADDFNPLHNTEGKRFCVPGDLLFAVVLSKYGVTRHMRLRFAGMVTEDVVLVLPEESPNFLFNGENGKNYLDVEHSGENSRDPKLIDNLTKSYVTFSGHTFPHILVPLMKEKGVMLNPDRPMVMYESMLIDLERLDLTDIQLELNTEKTQLAVDGKRGNVCLAFNLSANGELIGRGEKHMLVSGLIPYEQDRIDRVIADYNLWKQNYQRR